jgi:hypothetical protein
MRLLHDDELQTLFVAIIKQYSYSLFYPSPIGKCLKFGKGHPVDYSADS